MQELPTAAHPFLLSIQACILFICIFSMVYLSLRKWEINKWLVLAFFGFGSFILCLQLGVRGYDVVDPSFLFPNLSMMLLVPPSFYFYVRKLVGKEKLTVRNKIPHFLPVLIFFVWFLLTDAHSAKLVTHLSIPEPILVMAIVLGISSLLYNFKVYRLFQFNQLKYQDEYSDDNVFITLDWLKWMIWVLAFLPVLGVGNLIFGPFFNNLPEGSLVMLTILLYCSMLSFFSFRQPVLYKNEYFFDKKKDTVPDAPQAEESTSRQSVKTKIPIDEPEITALIAKLEKHMLDEKPFLNPKIRMPELAAELDIPRHIFSQLINEHYGMNFFSFINKYRIENVVQLLQGDASQQFSLEAIGQMSGFNSKSTFNSRFKEIMGLTPSEWIDSRKAF